MRNRQTRQYSTVIFVNVKGCATFYKRRILLPQSNKEGCAIERKPRRRPPDKYAINKERYDRLNILVPKGQKAVIEDFAKQANESINQYTNKALLDRMGYNTWPELEDKTL